MNDRLIVLIAESWPLTPAADWVALDARGTVTASGRSEPRHWPGAHSCTAVLDGAQCVWPEVSLPPAARREQPRLIAYALEAQLVRDPDQQHLTVTHRRGAIGDEPRGTQHCAVLAISVTRLRQIVAQFDAIGRPLDHVRTVLQTVPASDAHATLAIGPGATAVLRASPHSGIALDAPEGDDEALLDQLGLALDSARQTGSAMQRLALHVAPGRAAPDPADLAARLGVEIFMAGPPIWWKDNAAADLLHGAFAPRRRAGALWPRFVKPLALAAAAALALAVGGIVEVVSLRGERDAIEVRMAHILADALPGTPAIAPGAQLARALDTARREHGALAADDALALLAGVAASAGEMPQRFEYSEGRLVLPADFSDRAMDGRYALVGLTPRRSDGQLTLEHAR